MTELLALTPGQGTGKKTKTAPTEVSTQLSGLPGDLDVGPGWN